jgi:TRAP-type C4-dicarboxylate transport system permease small subunit
MDYLAKIVSRAGSGGMLIGVAFLLAAMMVMVANIGYRFFGGVITGTYEMVGIFVGVTITFALAYAALWERHVTVNILLNRFTQRTQAVLKIFVSLIGLAFWAAIAWTSLGVIAERWTAESTLDHRITYLPFRFLWIAGLVIFCLVFVVDIRDALRRLVRK